MRKNDVRWVCGGIIDKGFPFFPQELSFGVSTAARQIGWDEAAESELRGRAEPCNWPKCVPEAVQRTSVVGSSALLG